MKKTIPALGLSLLLAGCELGLNERQTAEAHDVASDAISESVYVATQDARIAALERRVAELEELLARSEGGR